MQALLRHGANPNKAFPCDPHRPMDQVPLVSMDWKPEDAACMVALLQGGLDPRPQTSNGVTILHKAMTMPFAAALQCVRLLVANPLTDVNLHHPIAGTRLHVACLASNIPLISALLNAGGGPYHTANWPHASTACAWHANATAAADASSSHVGGGHAAPQKQRAR